MKRTLVISGGGSRGAFAVGVLQQLKAQAPKLTFDGIVGTSTGALIAPLAATGELAELERLYTTITTDQLLTQHRLGDRLNEKSVYTVEKLYQLLKTVLTDARYQTIKASGKPVSVIATCLQTGDMVVFTTADNPKPSPLYKIKTVKSAEHLRLAVLASACQPVLMTPVKVDAATEQGTAKEYQYVDGGLRESAGVQVAIEQGATEVLCIPLADGKGQPVNTEYGNLMSLLLRTVDILTADVLQNDVALARQSEAVLNYLAAAKAKMKADGLPADKIDRYLSAPLPLLGSGSTRTFFISPTGPLGGGPGGLVFDPAEMKGMVQKGRRAAADFLAATNVAGVGWL